MAKSKTGSKDSKKKKKSGKRMGPKAATMKQETPKENPFETIWSRRKFHIIGKKRKGEIKRIGLARSRAIEKRKETLLKEYEQSGKSSVFIDKRIGEKNDELGEFDKAIIRSQRERQLKLKKPSKYNLSDGEDEDEFEGLGLGFPLEQDDFENEMLSDGDNDADVEADKSRKNSALLKQLTTATEEGEEDEQEMKHKTKKEVMEEVMLKSKFFKAQKSKEKEENEQLREELDKKFSSLSQSQVLLSVANKAAPFTQDQPDAYDKLVLELSMDMRARPSDRTKTQEEIAQEERERLERLEEERQKRMLAANDDSDDENEDTEKTLTQRPRSVSGDDLGDSFDVEEKPKTAKGWVDEILERKDADESENEDDTSEDSTDAESDGDDEDKYENDNDIGTSLKDWEQSDDDNLETDLQEDEEQDDSTDDEADEPEKQAQRKLKTNVEMKEVDGKERKIKANSEEHSTKTVIPYVIETPKDMEELSALLENHSNENIVEIIHRIRKSNAIALSAENRKKMQVFYGILLQYFAVLANKKPLNFELLNLLVKPLIEMSMEIPYFSAICARQRILQTRTLFCKAIKNPENGCWPSLKTLFLLRLWSMVFPCSDFRHVVMTPALLLMCEYLMRCPILSGRDIAVGSFLCSMVLSVCKQSKKFCPEAIIFLRSLLMAASGRTSLSDQESQFYHHTGIIDLRAMLRIHNQVNEVSPLNLLTVMSLSEDSSFFSSDAFRASVLLVVVETLRGFVDIYEGLNSFTEIFLPISTLCETAVQEKMPAILQDKFKEVSVLIQRKADEQQTLRQPLQMRKQKPVPIKMQNPKVEENFVKGRDYDPDRERAEIRKLKKHLKQETKGAIRELRKDNYFLAEVKEKEKAQLEEERAERYGKARAFLQEQEHAFRSGQLGKGRKRRR